MTYIKNYGAGFSILQNQTFFLIIITLIAIVLISYLLIKSKNTENFNRICYLFIIGGAVGNLIDRLSLGYVIDFLDFYIFGYNYPVFNLADTFIFIGVCILIYAVYLGEDNDNSSK